MIRKALLLLRGSPHKPHLCVGTLTPSLPPNHITTPNQAHLLTFPSHFRLVWEACPNLPRKPYHVSNNKPFHTLLMEVWHCQFQHLNQLLVRVHSVSEKWEQHLLYLFVSHVPLWLPSLWLEFKLWFSTTSAGHRKVTAWSQGSAEGSSPCYNEWPQIMTPLLLLLVPAN